MIGTRTIILTGLGLAAIVLLALFASPSAREWAIVAIASFVTLLLRGGDHVRRNLGGDDES